MSRLKWGPHPNFPGTLADDKGRFLLKRFFVCGKPRFVLGDFHKPNGRGGPTTHLTLSATEAKKLAQDIADGKGART